MGGPPQDNIGKAFWHKLREMQGSGLLPKGAVLGTVAARQYVTPAGWSLPLREPYSFWCDVQPEKEGESLLMHVPMPGRVMNTEDDLGVFYVPKHDTEALIEWIDGRPTITDAHEWEEFILKKDDSNYITWDSQNNVDVKTTGKITIETLKTAMEIATISRQIKAPRIILGNLGAYSAVLGEPLNIWLSTHTHTILKPTPGSQTAPPTQIPALPGHLSKVVKLD